jgi:glyoxylase-like metal-dependent hydrolase (beta-lactamase superfamily II)
MPYPDASEDAPAEVMISALPHPGYDVGAYELVPVVPTKRLVDGDVIDLGDRTLHVLHLPGHTPGSIGLYDPAARILFSGDTVYDPPDLLDELSHSSIPDYRVTMRRLLVLDVDRVYAGHGKPFDGRRLREIAAAYLDRRRDE